MIKVLPLKEAAELAISHRLYVPGWDMRSKLMYFIKYGYGLIHIALYYDGKTPVGCCFVTSGEDIQIFVRVSHRRQGIGTKFVQHMRKEMRGRADRLDAGKGVEGSGKFWAAMGIRRWDL